MIDDIEEFDVYGDEDLPVSEDVDVENLIKAVYKCRDEIAWQKKLRAARVEPIKEKIDKLESKESRLKEIILECMSKYFPKKNTVDFPGVGKITKRATKGSWKVSDDEAFIKLVRDNKLDEDVIKTKESIVAKFVPGIMGELLKELKQEDIDCVSFVEPESSHSVSFKFYEEEIEEDDGSVGF